MWHLLLLKNTQLEWQWLSPLGLVENPDIHIKEHLFGLANFSGVDPDDAGLS